MTFPIVATGGYVPTELDRLRAVNAQLLAALKLSVEHFGDPLKVAHAAIANAEGSQG